VVLIGAVIAALLMPAAAIAGDRDGDGLGDHFESRWGVTSPDRRDTDHDGIVDAAEDDDGDGLGNLGEQRFGTDPGSRDTDGDATSDGNDDSDHDGRRDARQQDERPIPAGLMPTLAGARTDRSGIIAGCVTRQGSGHLRPCLFGRRHGQRTLVLMGDSHAMMWVLPVVATAERKGWRLVTLFKGGCSPILGTKWTTDCRRWRRNALDWLDHRAPDLVVLAHSDDYRLADQDGQRIPRSAWPSIWRTGMLRTLSEMPGASRLLVLGDVPDNHRIPASCLAQHRSDMSACQSARQPRAERLVEDALRDATVRSDAIHRSTYDWLCTYDPCPLVQGRVLSWRDRSHITATIARRLTPSMHTTLLAAMTGERP
jgi:hypothetical protein